MFLGGGRDGCADGLDGCDVAAGLDGLLDGRDGREGGDVGREI